MSADRATKSMSADRATKSMSADRATKSMSVRNPTAETTADTLLDGRVRLTQPSEGYRVAIDPVLLAAAVPARPGEHIVDLGAGVGAATLCLAARVPECRITAIEIDHKRIKSLSQNIEINEFSERVNIIEGCIQSLGPTSPAPVDHVMANPPYLPVSRADPAHLQDRATVEGESLSLSDWLSVALSLVRAKGSVTFIQRADRLDDILAGLRGQAGDIMVYPLWPKAGRAAKRVLVRARRGVASPLSLKSGMILHQDGGAYTAAAERVLRHAAALDFDRDIDD
jgi:tRNA1(Val) A37 N6-methylase TrmN6